MGDRRIDLNADLGESFGRWVLGDDEAMLDVVTSANVACGFHAGDPTTLRRVCARAAERGVPVGAQVSYPDLVGFGRRVMDMDAADLAAAVIYQIGALEAMCQVAGTSVGYVKPHGALYNRVVDDEAQARAVVAAVRDYDPDLPILGLPGSRLLDIAADLGHRTVAEAFADRAYTPDGRLLPRTEAGALITAPERVAERAVRMALDHQVTAIDGSTVPVEAASICVHGDSPGAVTMARTVRAALADAGVGVESFV